MKALLNHPYYGLAAFASWLYDALTLIRETL